jgi:hypothetical protein
MLEETTMMDRMRARCGSADRAPTEVLLRREAVGAVARMGA